MPRAPRYSLRLAIGLAAGVLAGAVLRWISCANGAEPVKDEAMLKIQFMHYVAQYAVWPKEALSPNDRQFVLGVLGPNPFGEKLENYFKGKSVKGRPFLVKSFETVEEVLGSLQTNQGCQMLFISSSEKSNFGEILKHLEDISILTISDGDGFVQKNGMIYMFINQSGEISGKLGWDINPQAMKKVGLQIDPFFIEKARKSTH